MLKLKLLLGGAGISNLTLARLFAELGHSVSIFDRKDHIGGNCFDYFDETPSIFMPTALIFFIRMTRKSGDSFLNLHSGIRTSMK